jgi:enoyl-[acyl-carrier protein] reductase I
MSKNLLEGKRGIVFGALDENSIAWKTAQIIHQEGGSFVLTNAPIAMRLGKIDELAAECGSEVIPADATSIPDLENLVSKSMEILGGKLDFVLHSIGMSPNVRKGKPYGDLNYDWMQKSLDISAISFHKVMQTCEKLDAMNEWGSILALSYIAAQRTYPDYSDMAQAKAMLESIARSYGERYGQLKNVRVNTISQSPTMTRAGTGVGGFDAFLDFAQNMSPLGNASAEACANYIAVMFSDYTRLVTMQNLMHDGGFSNSGMTQKVIDKILLAKD